MNTWQIVKMNSHLARSAKKKAVWRSAYLLRRHSKYSAICQKYTPTDFRKKKYRMEMSYTTLSSTRLREKQKSASIILYRETVNKIN